MGNKDLMVYIKKEGSNKQAYCCDPSDTIQEVKENILTKAYYTTTKKKLCVSPGLSLCLASLPLPTPLLPALTWPNRYRPTQPCQSGARQGRPHSQ